MSKMFVLEAPWLNILLPCVLHIACTAVTCTGRAGASEGPAAGGFPAWQPQRIRALVGVSGAYNCIDLADHFNRRGLYRKLFNKIMSVNGQSNLKLISPTFSACISLFLCVGYDMSQMWETVSLI